MPKKNWHILDNWFTTHGTRFVFFSRFIPVIAFNLINYAAGLTSISWTKFGLATGLGILPVVVILVMFGNYIEFISWQILTATGVIVVVLWVVFHKYYKNRSDNILVNGAHSEKRLDQQL